MMFERYYRELLNFITGMTGDRHGAADVVQETYARVLALPEGQQVTDPRALLYRTARNLVIDEHRRGVVRAAVALDEADGIADRASQQPDNRLAGQQIALHLLDVVETLPPRCREAFVLFKFEGLAQADIAERMGITRNAVEKHIIAGMVACKRAMATLEDSGDASRDGTQD
ncbi:sigma-70 family RNA polymerase sigma factor [Uliginosibacterium sp. H1]|uniref:sigma-70 family RNA polymerase sigma factor n=1 Tax=Uliginosibacterium sp. H1 TaxID=3114757 RepID=UPI002E19DDF8|nr:sigma-70 family RNA polymerase sigma factor [Uliginosibacterium sp. H1]